MIYLVENKIRKERDVIIMNYDRINKEEFLNIISAELNRYQDMTQEVLDYIVEHEDIKEVNEIYNIIKKWAC